MTQPKHKKTQLQLHTGEDYIAIYDADDIVIALQPNPATNDKKNFKFIVRACNSFYELVAALEVMLEYAEKCDSWESFPFRPMDIAYKALEKAKATS